MSLKSFDFVAALHQESHSERVDEEMVWQVNAAFHCADKR